MDEHQRSEFNMAFSYMSRLNTLFYAMIQANMSRDIVNWCDTLIILFRELSTQMSEEDFKKKDKEIKLIKGEINQYQVRKIAGESPGIDPKLFWKLSDFEVFLRRTMNEAGLEMKYTEDPRFSLK